MSTDRCGCSNADETLHRLTPPSHFLSVWFSVDLFILVSFHFLLYVSLLSSLMFLHFMLFGVDGWCCLFLTTLDCGITLLFLIFLALCCEVVLMFSSEHCGSLLYINLDFYSVCKATAVSKFLSSLFILFFTNICSYFSLKLLNLFHSRHDLNFVS